VVGVGGELEAELQALEARAAPIWGSQKSSLGREEQVCGWGVWDFVGVCVWGSENFTHAHVHVCVRALMCMFVCERLCVCV